MFSQFFVVLSKVVKRPNNNEANLSLDRNWSGSSKLRFLFYFISSSLFFIQLQMWKLNERKCLGNLLFRYFGNLNFRQVFKGWKRPLNLLDFSFKKSQHKIATEWKVWFSLVVWCYWKLSQNSFNFLIKTDRLTNNY